MKEDITLFRELRAMKKKTQKRAEATMDAAAEE